jgi:Uma2 family endonuclease
MSEVPTTYLTAEEYLALERAARDKSEYLDGQMVAMPGASYAHNLITANFIYAIRTQLRGSPCKVLGGDMRILAPVTGLYTYPDVIVLRGEPDLTDKYFDTLTNPTVIIEVLSPSTEAYDRGKKFQQYRTVDSLREYLLVSQDRPSVEQFIRQDNGEQWILTVVTDLAAGVVLPSIGCQLALADIYDQVRFKA